MMKLEYVEQATRLATQHEFLYPQTLRMGMRFPNKEEIIYLLQQEALKKDLPLNLYIYPVYYPCKKDWRFYSLSCRICGAKLTFYKVTNDFVAKTVQYQHIHGERELALYELRRAAEAESLKKLALNYGVKKEASMKSLMKASLMGSQAVATKPTRWNTSPTYFPRKPTVPTWGKSMLKPEPQTQTELAGFSTIENWLKNRGYYCQLVFASKGDSYPEIMVMSTLEMKDNCTKYGDLMAFDIADKRATTPTGQSFHIAAFAVPDNNSRPLIVAFAYFRQLNTSSIINVFLQFKDLHDIVPETLITANLPELNAAIAKMKRTTGWECTHIYDTTYIMKTLQKQLEMNSTTNSSRILIDFQEAMQVRVPETYSYLFKKLESESSQIGKLLEQKSRIFYCDIRASFIGLKRNLCSKVGALVKAAIKYDNLQLVIEQLHSACQTLEKESQKVVRFEEACMLSNSRIDEVCDNFEKEVVERFVENYLEGIKNYSVVADTEDAEESHDYSQDNPQFVVEDTATKSRFPIRDWECKCGELEKTGVPCAHLLSAANSVPKKSFVSLIRKRWLKRSVHTK